MVEAGAGFFTDEVIGFEQPDGFFFEIGEVERGEVALFSSIGQVEASKSFAEEVQEIAIPNLDPLGLERGKNFVLQRLRIFAARFAHAAGVGGEFEREVLLRQNGRKRQKRGGPIAQRFRFRGGFPFIIENAPRETPGFRP